MAKKHSMHKKKGFTIPLAIVAGFIPAVNDITKNKDSFGGYGASAKHTVAGLVGYDTVTNKYVGWTQAKAAGAPGIVLGFGIHMLASKLGINRMIASAGIPFVRI
jgi:hypothetical protein